MNRPPHPPGQVEEVHAESVLVLAPHYDDEVLGCGGLLAQLVAAGAVVRVLFLSDGADGEEGDAASAYRERRRAEAQAAAEVLGVAGVDELGLPDGSLQQHGEELVRGIRRALTSQRPRLLLTPSPLEQSADHRATFAAVHRLLSKHAGDEALAAVGERLEVLAYEVNRPLYPDLLVDIDAQLPSIERAMGCYASQQERHDYLAAKLGLARYRTLSLPAGVEAAEAYRRLTIDDLATRGPTRLIAELGGQPEQLEVAEGPRISVVVRTRDRPELLAEALGSLAAGTYRRLQVIVVNDGGAEPTLPESFPLEIELISLPENRGRAAAANCGIAAASGDYVAFLDDDDLVERDHFAALVGAVGGAGVRVVYSDAAVGVYELGADGWSCVERRLPYSRDFDADLLLFDNYIPFNTLLIERQLLAEVGELDPELPFFEDWDLLIRLAARVSFHHLRRVTCEYRHFRGSGAHILGDQPRQRADFLAMKARVIERHGDRRTAAATARTIDALRAEAVAERERTTALRAELETAEARRQRLHGRLAGIERHVENVEASEHRAAERLAESHAARARVEARLADVEAQRDDIERQLQEEGRTLQGTYDELEKAYSEIDRLGELIRAMESTKAWRLHQAWQRRRNPS